MLPIVNAKIPGGFGDAVSLFGVQPHGLHLELSAIDLSFFL